MYVRVNKRNKSSNGSGMFGRMVQSGLRVLYSFSPTLDMWGFYVWENCNLEDKCHIYTLLHTAKYIYGLIHYSAFSATKAMQH